jgi:hypothetical protein
MMKWTPKNLIFFVNEGMNGEISKFIGFHQCVVEREGEGRERANKSHNHALPCNLVIFERENVYI